MVVMYVLHQPVEVPQIASAAAIPRAKRDLLLEIVLVQPRVAARGAGHVAGRVGRDVGHAVERCGRGRLGLDFGFVFVFGLMVWFWVRVWFGCDGGGCS